MATAHLLQTLPACHGGEPSAPWWSAARFMARGDCGAWGDGFRLLYMTAEFVITLAYLAIPICLFMAYREIHSGRTGGGLSAQDQSRLLLGFFAFISLCGLGHLEGVVSFWWPAYHVFALWHALTAAVSCYVVGLLIYYKGRELVLL